MLDAQVCHIVRGMVSCVEMTAPTERKHRLRFVSAVGSVNDQGNCVPTLNTDQSASMETC